MRERRGRRACPIGYNPRALAYLGFVLILTWQALSGVPVVAPDTPTLFALLAAAGTVASLGVLSARRAWAR